MKHYHFSTNMDHEAVEFESRQKRHNRVGLSLSTSTPSPSCRTATHRHWLLEEAVYIGTTFMLGTLVLTPLILNRILEPQAPVLFVLSCSVTLYGLLGLVRCVAAVLRR